MCFYRVTICRPRRISARPVTQRSQQYYYDNGARLITAIEIENGYIIPDTTTGCLHFIAGTYTCTLFRPFFFVLDIFTTDQTNDFVLRQ